MNTLAVVNFLLRGVTACAPGAGAISAPISIAADGSASVKLVFQVSEGERQMKLALFAARREIGLYPDAKIEIVAWGDGVRALLDDPLFDDVHAAVRELTQRGVLVKACADSVRWNNPDRATVLPQVEIVPSGTLEAARLQRRGYAYIRS